MLEINQTCLSDWTIEYLGLVVGTEKGYLIPVEAMELFKDKDAETPTGDFR